MRDESYTRGANFHYFDDESFFILITLMNQIKERESLKQLIIVHLK